jgi:NAD(P)-dependent dehydrogenase (short-subunit alcohol dehydrogenase family)
VGSGTRSASTTPIATALVDRLEREQGRVDVLVLDFWGDDEPVPFGTPFWAIPFEAGRQTIERTLWPHVITLQALVPLLRRRAQQTPPSPPLVVEVADGPGLHYRTSFFFDLAAVLRARLAYAVAEELAPDGITAIGVSPGYLRSELTLDRLGVTEDNWRVAADRDPAFNASETPSFLGRAIAAVAADPLSGRWSGGLYGSWTLARAYGLRDLDGAIPDFGGFLARTYGESPGPLRTGARWSVSGAQVTESTTDRSQAIQEGV